MELLSPAKNLVTGKAAISAGADAVYIGAGKFGARAAAGNTIEDIRELAAWAHLFFARVYVTVNTLLYEDELSDVEKLIGDLYEAGADAIIIQDPAILKMDLPPIALHASTQMHNHTPERVRFLQDAGVSQVVLARELSLEQITEIKNHTSVKLEAFVHGSLCVSYSGRCYMSEHIGGRSANRGECAQPCRNSYDLVDDAGNVIVHDKHLLSLRDLNLSTRIGPMMDAGITSFKIEGRLKDVDYVKNITAYYRNVIDMELANRPVLKKSSSGTIKVNFEPDPLRTFNRGFSEYFISGRRNTVTNACSPKSEGKLLGKVISVKGNLVRLDLQDTPPVNGDGLCWYDASGKLIGTRINTVINGTVTLNDTMGLKPGIAVMRNYDKAFAENLLREDATVRTIAVDLEFMESTSGFTLKAVDEDGISAVAEIATEKIPARNPDTCYARLEEQLRKTGNTIYKVNKAKVDVANDWFLQSSVINALRRNLLENLSEARLDAHKSSMATAIEAVTGKDSGSSTSEKKRVVLAIDPLTGKENISNSLAEEFYKDHHDGSTAEIAMQDKAGNGVVKDNGPLMTTRMCLKYELGKCPVYQQNDPNFPKSLYLRNKDSKFRLSFDCKACVMRLYAI